MLIVPAIAQAHAGHKHKILMGTVEAIDASHIDLTTKDGRKVAVPLAKNTMFMRGDAMVGSDQVKPGTRVVIVLGEDDKTASNVKIGAAPKRK